MWFAALGLILAILVKIANGVSLIDDVVFTIITQQNSFHVNQALEKREIWSNQLRDLTRSPSSTPRILLTHDLDLDGAAWTISPILDVLSPYIPTTVWFFFALEETVINFTELEAVLHRHDPHEELFLGHSMVDLTPTILHHYVGANLLQYPNFPSGWVLSTAALDKILNHISKFSPSFNIDPQYEFAQFVRYLRTLPVTELLPHPPPPPDDGIELTHVPEFCISIQPHVSCATSYQHTIPICEGGLTLKDVHFAVKTCSQFHTSRLTVLKSIWGSDAGNSIAYYSDIEDPAYSTINTGIPNTERGHCGKTEAIIKKFYADTLLDKNLYQWLVIADDDTLLSVPRLLQLLRCYNSSQPILLGEVYGYFAHKAGGTSYVTGGGSMVLSRAAVVSLINSAHHCPSIDAADDMYLGSVAESLSWDIVHSPLFHQAQPDSFQAKVLSQQTSISFHRHRPKDPAEIYQEYLLESGKEHTDREHGTVPVHRTEL